MFRTAHSFIVSCGDLFKCPNFVCILRISLYTTMLSSRTNLVFIGRQTCLCRCSSFEVVIALNEKFFLLRAVNDLFGVLTKFFYNCVIACTSTHIK